MLEVNMSFINKAIKVSLGIIVALILVSVIAAFAFGTDSGNSGANDIGIDDNSEIKNIDQDEVSQGNYAIGDKVVVGEVAYTVISVDVDEGDPVWVDLGVEIENLGKDTREYYLPDNYIKLISEKDQKYEPLDDLTTWERGFDELRPGIPMEVYLVFEVPRGQRYYAEVGDSTWNDGERIDIGIVPS